MSDEIKVDKIMMQGQPLAQRIAAERDALRECVTELEARVKELEGNDSKSIDEEYEHRGDETGFESLRRWVKAKTLECEQEGAIFDTIFRCVDEGGSTFYFDPESVVELMDELDRLREENEQLRAIVERVWEDN